MKAIHRIYLEPDLMSSVAVFVPAGTITALGVEGDVSLYVHILGDVGPGTQTRDFIFAEAINGVMASSLLDSTDLTEATYLGYANSTHVWMLPAA